MNVGFALMTLQRRLASSPFAIHRSIERRRERLESGSRRSGCCCRAAGRGAPPAGTNTSPAPPARKSIDELYEEDTAEEVEATENVFADNATSAQTLAELELEIQTLKQLEKLSRRWWTSAPTPSGATRSDPR